MDADLIRARLERVAELVSPAHVLSVITEDPDDDRVLECAIAGRADIIISGDRHVLKLGEYEGIAIMTARQFMDRIVPSA